MSPEAAPARSAIEAWREQHADALDPWRFHVIDALEKRAAKHTGKARQLLDHRLSRLMDRYADDLTAATRPAVHPASNTVLPNPVRGPLGELVDHLASRAPIMHEDSVDGDAAAALSDPEELPALDAFRKTWSRLRLKSQLQQVQTHAPANAGPLNSATLVHRSVALMRELSPGYLAHFLSYIDDLSWLEQMAGSPSTAPATLRPGNSKKRTRRKPKPAPTDERQR